MGFGTPEEAALDSWATTSGVEPQVTSVTVRGDRAEVVLNYGEFFDDWVYCTRDEDGWSVRVDGNGPVTAWDNPDEIQWEVPERPV